MKKTVFFGFLAIMLVIGFIGCENGNNVNEFTVTFDLDGGNINGSTTSVILTTSSGGTISNIPSPNKDEYDFGGFFLKKTGKVMLLQNQQQ